jgi:hypothetical protein
VKEKIVAKEANYTLEIMNTTSTTPYILNMHTMLLIVWGGFNYHSRWTCIFWPVVVVIIKESVLVIRSRGQSSLYQIYSNNFHNGGKSTQNLSSFYVKVVQHFQLQTHNILQLQHSCEIIQFGGKFTLN